MRLENEKRREVRAIASKRLEARRHWHWLVLQHLRGLGARDARSAPYPSEESARSRREITVLIDVRLLRGAWGGAWAAEKALSAGVLVPMPGI